MASRSGKRSSKTERVAAELKRRVADGTYPPHSYFPAERDLATELGIGRPTVRAAIDLLERQHLVLQTQGRGTRVLPPMERLRSNVIGIVRAPQPTIPRKYEATVAGVEEEFLRQGYGFEQVPNAMVASSNNGSHTKEPVPVSADLLAERYGALVFVETDPYKEVPLELERRKIPVVVAGIEIDLPVSATYTDHAKASRIAVETLVGMGHKRIAFIGLRPDRLFYGKTREGYLAGLQEAAIPADPRLIVTTEHSDPLSAYMSARSLLDVKPRPTAVVAARDYMAHGVWMAFSEAGCTIGRDVSIIGFDDVSWRQDEPFLTTFHEPSFEMGIEAARMLIRRIVEGWRPPERREVEAPLILRRSAGPAPETEPPLNGAAKAESSAQRVMVE